MTIVEQRALSASDRYQLSKELTKAYGSVTLTAIVSHAVGRSADDDPNMFYMRQLYPALARTVQKQPLLRAVVLDSKKPSARFATLPQVDLAAMVTVYDGSRFWEQDVLDSIIATTADQTFDTSTTTKPLWALRVDTHHERPHECAITWRNTHVIGDGKTIQIFMTDLLEELQSGAGADECAAKRSTFLVDTTHEPLPPPYDERKPAFGDAPPCTSKEVESILWRGDYETVRDKSQGHDTVVRTMRVGDTHWPRIIRACKARGISPHAAVMAAATLAFAELYPDQHARFFTAVNTRPFVTDPPASNSEPGNFYGGFSRIWDGSQQQQHEFWPLAVEYHAYAQKHKRDAARYVGSVTDGYSYPEDYCTAFYANWTEQPMGRAGGVCVSDLGLLSLAQKTTEPAWHLQQIYFCQSAFYFGFALVVNSISTPHAVHVAVSWQRDALDPSKIGPYAQTMARYLCASVDQ